ncbi:MAG: UDP-2,3-diacylglucosamine diphosphatase [Calditrichaeota bacterium]|nr:UDP-2,3-diacylglucosamine diphosphatase [Calditrichota bacterium]MCB9369807.1 UDP-2,3-diacylglucosamine diphosphatase [Calditrichota bacterium]
MTSLRNLRENGSVLVISDLHLGSPNCNAEGIIETLENSEFDTLVINGDTYDNPNLHRLRRPHREVLTLIWDLYKRRKEVIWIKGNHDSEILPLFNENLLELHIETPHGKIGILHGHQFDNFIRKYPITTEIASRAYYYIQRCVRSNRFSEYVKYTSKSWLNVIKRVRSRALEYAEKQDFRFVVCGHVHHQEVCTENGRTYINTGSFMDTAQEGVLINWDKNRFDIAKPAGYEKPTFVEDFITTVKPVLSFPIPTIDPRLAAASLA